MARLHLIGTLLILALQTGTVSAQGMGMSEMMGGHWDERHFRLTPDRQATVGDVRRAQELAIATRQAIEKYQDVRVAEADGYMGHGGARLREVHYVNRQFSRAEMRQIDPSRPGSLLYAPQPDGSMKLTGAMFMAPSSASLAELNARVPLSQARWHLHLNVCTPVPRNNMREWMRRGPDGGPLYGPRGHIASKAECDAVGGSFDPQPLGWMVHVYPFRNDPAEWWEQRQE